MIVCHIPLGPFLGSIFLGSYIIPLASCTSTPGSPPSSQKTSKEMFSNQMPEPPQLAFSHEEAATLLRVPSGYSSSSPSLRLSSDSPRRKLILGACLGTTSFFWTSSIYDNKWGSVPRLTCKSRARKGWSILGSTADHLCSGNKYKNR